MNSKTYLMQVYRLDNDIKSTIEEIDQLKELSVSVSSPSWEEKTSSQSFGGDAKFVKVLQRIEELQNSLSNEIIKLMELKEEIKGVINNLQNVDERMVLKYRYIHNYTWERIADVMNADSSTIRRWHETALKNVVVPKKV